jgi:hypothetical protein
MLASLTGGEFARRRSLRAWWSRSRRTIAIASALAAAAIANAATQARLDTAVLRRDRIVSLALELNDAAIRSLHTTPDQDVPGTLAVRAGATRPAAVDVEVRLKGQRGSRRSLDNKPALRIRVVKGERALGFRHLTLNNMVQDPTMVHEAVGYQVYAAAGVPVPDTAYARLTINGQPYGLYLLVETIDRQFLERRFGNASGILYEGSYGTDLREGHEQRFELDEGKDPGRRHLARLIRAVETADDALFYGPGALIDTASFLAMMAAGVVIADWDNYYQANNYRIYWNPPAARWVFIPTGIDQTFVRESTSIFGGSGALFRRCLESARCTADYVRTVYAVVDRFEQMDLPARMDRFAVMLDEALREDRKKPYSMATIDKARERMRHFIEARPDVIRSMTAPRRPPPSPAPPPAPQASSPW